MDFTANTNAITLDMTQVLQTAISDLNYRFAVDLISSVLHVKIIDSTNTMRLNMQLNHSVASTPVVRIGQSATEGSLVMCTYEANSSTNNVYFDQVALNGDTVSFSTTTWAQCLAATGPTSTVSNALFLLMQADLMVKTVKINFSSGLILTKSSAAALQNFLSFDATSTTAYGILFHEEQFIFGVTSHIYDKTLTGNGGFLTSLENYRLNDFYTGDYASDADISSNSVSTTSVQSTEAVTDGSISCDVQTTTYTTDTEIQVDNQPKHVWQFTVDRHGYIAASCPVPKTPVSDLLFCLLDGSTWEQRCIWEPIDLSQYEKAYADVCFPFWFKDEVAKGQGEGQAYGMVYEENKVLYPAAFKSFALTFNGSSQLSRTNDDPINTIGEGLFMSLNMNDRWNTEGLLEVQVFSPFFVLIARHDAVFGISETYPILNFLTEELDEKYQPVLLGCDSSTILPMPDEGLDGSCKTDESLSDGTMVGDLAWLEFKKQDWFKWTADPEWSPQTRLQSPQFLSLPIDQQNLVNDLIAAQTIWFDGECKNELPYVSYNSDHREVQKQDLNIKGCKIDGELSKDWKCFATYHQFCRWTTSSSNTFSSWTLTYFSPPSQEVIEEEEDDDDDEEDEEDEAIEIGKPWAEFYLDNLESGRWVMDPPSLDQILESELSPGDIAVLMSRLYPDYQPEQDPAPTDGDDDNGSQAPTSVSLTQDQINEAKSQAQYRADNDELQRGDPISLQYDINKDGILAIQFSRTVIMPKYMLDLINEAMKPSSAEDLDQDQAAESDPTAGEENADQAAESDPTAGEENANQAAESDPAAGEENADQAAESDPAAGEENADQAAESDPAVEGENADQATESDQIAGEENADQAAESDPAAGEENAENQNAEADPLAEEQATEKQDEIAEQAVDESTTSQEEVAATNGTRRRRNLSGTGVLRTQVADIQSLLSLSAVVENNFINPGAGGDAFKSQFQAVANSIKNEEIDKAADKKDNQCDDGYSLDPDTGLCVDDNPPPPPVVIEEEPEPELEWYLSTLDAYISIRIQKANGETAYVRWSIVEASNGSFEIQLNKEDLTSIQQGDELVVDLEGLNKLDGGLPDRQPSVDIDLSLFAPVIEQERVQSAATTSATSMLLLSTAIKIATNGSMAELWGAINGMQIASNQPIISIEIARNAAEFSSAVAGIVTFDIPGLDMESAFGWAGLEMPEEDPILMDIDEGVVSDETEIGGVPWSELKTTFLHDPCWARKDCGKSLIDNEQTLLTRLMDAQEAVGWELHDQRRIGYNVTWKDIKEQTMDPQFKLTDWFAELNDKQVTLVENLRWAQRRQGNMSELILQPSPLGETPGSGQIFIDSLDLMGFANAYLSRGLGTAFLWILYASAGLLALLFLLPFGRFQFAQKAIDRLKGDFLWNVVLRTVMQTSLEFGFCCYFCLKYAEFDGSVGTVINFVYAYLFTVLLIIFPFFFIIFYKKHFETFREVRYNKLAGLDEKGYRIQYDEIAFQTCAGFYQDESMEEVIKQIIEGEENQTPVEITPLDKDQLEFLKALQLVHYIEDAEIIRETEEHKAIVELNGNFLSTFEADMEREVVRGEFMDKFGDPLEGFDLEKPVVIWFPTHFMAVRIIFVVGALGLWSNPMALLLLRVFTSLIGFCIVVQVGPLDSHRANKLEMMNEATVIFIVDCIIFCTDLLNAGNENDLNEGSVPDLLSARAFIGSLYIFFFLGNITVHMSFLAYDQIRTSIGGCRKKRAMWNNKLRRERTFQKKNPSELEKHGIKYRPFWRGMCRRVFGTTAIYENVVIEDVKLGIRTGGAEVRHAREGLDSDSDSGESADKSVRHGLVTRKEPQEFSREPHEEPPTAEIFQAIVKKETEKTSRPVPPTYSKSISQLIIPEVEVSKEDVLDIEDQLKEDSHKKSPTPENSNSNGQEIGEQNIISGFAESNDFNEEEALNAKTNWAIQEIARKSSQDKSNVLEDLL